MRCRAGSRSAAHGPSAVVAGGSSANQSPTAALLTPQSGGNYSAPATIVVAAEGSDPDGTINRVEFYAGSTKIGQDSTSPYTMTWSSIAAGTYNLTAQAIDNEGAVGVSAARTITVKGGDDGGALPAPWTTAAIGNPAHSGSATYADSQFTVAGGGKDIWGTTDSFRFVSQPLTGNGTLSARVVSQTATDPWAKAGVMLRDGQGATARHAMVVVTPQKGVSFQRRTTAGGASAHTSGSMAKAPRWVRLVRAGDVITGAESANGSSWTTIGSTTIALPATVRAGLCVTSHNNSTVSTAVFAQVTLAPSGGG